MLSNTLVAWMIKMDRERKNIKVESCGNSISQALAWAPDRIRVTYAYLFRSDCWRLARNHKAPYY